MVGRSGEVITDLQEMVGRSLRVVATYDRTGYEIHFVREDVEAELDPDRVDDVYREMILEGLGREYLETLFDAGPLVSSAHAFEELIAFHFAMSDTTGLYVALDAGIDVPLARFLDHCDDLKTQLTHDPA